jgi:LysM domain/N-acetylmuramoyl-L-alanine amidase
MADDLDDEQGTDEQPLPPDDSPEATAEAGLTEEGVASESQQDVEFEDDGSAPRDLSDLPLAWMAAALRESGLVVKEVKGWRTRGRPVSFDPRGVVFHHTASNRNSGPRPALGTVLNGRTLADGSPLPGPLCNILVGRDSVMYLVAAGRANHAGLGGPWRNIPVDSGNKYMIGVEVENDGIGEPFSKELLQACEVAFATLLVRLGRGAGFLAGHKEWAPHRKTDPARVQMDQFRQRVAKEMRALKQGKPGGPQKPPQPQKLPQPQPQAGQPAASAASDIYVVKAGDTLFAIATKHGMSVDELMKLNGLTGTLIHPGDKLKVKRA